MINLSAKRVCITGASGFLGSPLVTEIAKRGCRQIFTPRHEDFDLCTQDGVRKLFEEVPIDIVIHAAGFVGGIGFAQSKPGEMFYRNALMGILMMEEARKASVQKYVQIGTVCEYPKYTSVPFNEVDLWYGYPEETNASYGVAKRALLTMGQAYREQYKFNVIHLLLGNMYGPNDDFNLDTSHVIAALVHKFVSAKKNGETQVVVWGDGSASREFLYVKDAAEAIVNATELYDEPEPVNIGSGFQILIKDLVSTIAELVGYTGGIVYDESKPNGQMRRALDVSRSWNKFGFVADTGLKDGLRKTIDWYTEHESKS